MTAVSLRRSGRSRKQSENYYVDAKKAIDEEERKRESLSTVASSRIAEENSEDESLEEIQEESPESSSDEEDFQPKPKKRKSASPNRGRRANQTPSKMRVPKVQIQVKPILKKKPVSRLRGRTNGRGRQNKLNQTMLAVARKVLDKSETEENSLLAALLGTYKSAKAKIPLGDDDTAPPKKPLLFLYSGKSGKQYWSTTAPSQATAMEELARRVISWHRDDPNAAQCYLLNFMFRSIGGTVDSCLDAADFNLENMENDTWVQVVTDLVDDMRHAQPEKVLLCADPNGPKGDGQHNYVTSAESVASEYRRIYSDFWRVLGLVALSDGMATTSANVIRDDEAESDSEGDYESGGHHKTPSSEKGMKRSTSLSVSSKPKRRDPMASTTENMMAPSRFDAELVRDLILRVTELVSVGQPDVRAAATLAALNMGHAILDRTVVLRDKLTVAQRQFDAAVRRVSTPRSAGKAVKKQQQPGSLVGEKAESLRHQIDFLRRSIADLEEVVVGPIFNGIFMHRYRDSNGHIRAMCMMALSRMTLQRPDIFLCDKFLKYFGWLLSDKDEFVRAEAVGGLLAPFEVHEAEDAGDRVGDESVRKGESGTGSGGGVGNIDLGLLEHVTSKFLPRLADCTIDVAVSVQEKAMKLLLHLLREGFLDEMEDDAIWNQINFRALAATDASPVVRRDALYFVFEQLEAFDDGLDDEDEDHGNSGKANTTTVESSERKASQRLDALASWVAHTLSDGPIPLDLLRVELTDLVVCSLRDMPEHRHLITDWSALLRAIMDDAAATTMEGRSAGDRVNVAKQRVLVRMLACAARAEVWEVADTTFLSDELEEAGFGAVPSYSDNRRTGRQGGTARAAKSGLQHEALSIALLKVLPNLLVKFSGDTATLESLCSLPRLLIPTVFSLPQRKKDFESLSKSLHEIYMRSQDDGVLHNVALSLSYLARGDHTRAPDAKLHLQQIIQELKGRIDDLVKNADGCDESIEGAEERMGTKTPSRRKRQRNKSSLSSNSTVSDSTPDVNDEISNDGKKDREYSLYLALKRLRILSHRCDLCDSVGGEGELEAMTKLIAGGMSERLQKIKEKSSSLSEASRSTSFVAFAEALDFFVACTAWRLRAVQEEKRLVLDDEDSEAISTEGFSSEEEHEMLSHPVVLLRNRVVALTELCFELDLFENDGGEEDDCGEEGSRQRPSPDRISFSKTIQAAAFRAASDLRTLFPKDWSDAAHPLLRALALTSDGKLIGGSVRYFRSQEYKLRLREGIEREEDLDAPGPEYELLLPLARGLVTNWPQGNRREAGVLLAHLTGSGQEAGNLVRSAASMFKKADPFRLLESHMASLRQSYDDWIENEPRDIESDRPTDEEMAEFEAAERAHIAQFRALENQAQRLSMSLGVGRLTVRTLMPALLRFVKEGIRFSFSTGDADSEDELVLGSRLSFLSVLGKYVNWIKRNKAQREELREELNQREQALRAHEEFEDVHEDDLRCLSVFRVALGLQPLQFRIDTEDKLASSVVSTNYEEYESGGEGASRIDAVESPGTDQLLTTPSTSLAPSSADRGSSGRPSSINSSVRSKGMSSVRSSVDLSPLYEHGGSDEEESTPATASVEADSATATPSDFGSNPAVPLGTSQTTYDHSVDRSQTTEGSVSYMRHDGDSSDYSSIYSENKRQEVEDS